MSHGAASTERLDVCSPCDWLEMSLSARSLAKIAQRDHQVPLR
jgi:hypothetical protein